MKKNFRTTYSVAVNWLHNNFVMVNNICEIDNSVYENMEFPLEYYITAEGEEIPEYEYDEEFHGEAEHCTRDIFQWFITDCSKSDKNYLQEHFDLLFSYSELLDCWVLCVDHFGTMWKGVWIDTDLEFAAEKAKEDSF